jgi:CRISPR-associated exonuclease Cas4
MRSEYRSDELLPLSGIQHFVFCRRQWALIQVEQQWQDNARTVEGKLMHKRVDDPYFSETRRGVITARSVPVSSYQLGLSGICDMVEFNPSPDGVNLPGKDGTYIPAPVEYKRGVEKLEPSDEAQLCAQAICLEEMLLAAIPIGFIYYGQTRRRVEVELTTTLREFVFKMSHEMHAYFKRGYTPRVKTSNSCRACSLADICLPKLQDKLIPASEYIQQQIDGP